MPAQRVTEIIAVIPETAAHDDFPRTRAEAMADIDAIRTHHEIKYGDDTMVQGMLKA
jgi:hypothetical protein